MDITFPVGEVEDPKAKKAPPPKGAPVEEEPEGPNELKVSIDVKNPNEDQRKFALSFQVVFQGEAYEDPNPPEEDPKAKKKPDEPVIKMITPDPIVMEKEDNRVFEIELGR